MGLSKKIGWSPFLLSRASKEVGKSIYLSQQCLESTPKLIIADRKPPMNPKDYAYQYRSRTSGGEKSDAVIADIHNQFIAETREIFCRQRVKNDVVLIGILKEQDQKWRSLSRMVKDIPMAGFVFGIFSIIPEIYNAAAVQGFLQMMNTAQKEN